LTFNLNLIIEKKVIICYDVLAMKTGIHPKYQKSTIKCACGNEFETRSTVAPEIQVELCSVCHPFYTGKQKFVDTAGRVDKFQARLKAAEARKKSEKGQVKDSNEVTTEKKNNKDVLKEIKSQIDPVKEAKPMTVTQEMSSDVEAAAASELEAAKKPENQ